MSKTYYQNITCDKFIIKKIRSWIKNRSKRKFKPYMDLEEAGYQFTKLLFSAGLPSFSEKVLIQKSQTKPSTYYGSIPSIKQFFTFCLEDDGRFIIKVGNEEKEYSVDETGSLSLCSKKVDFPSYSVKEKFFNQSYKAEVVCEGIEKIDLAVSYKTDRCIETDKKNESIKTEVKEEYETEEKIKYIETKVNAPKREEKNKCIETEKIVSALLHGIGISSQSRVSIDVFWRVLSAGLESELKENIQEMRISFSKLSNETDSLKWIETDYIELEPYSTTLMTTKKGRKMTITDAEHWIYKGTIPGRTEDVIIVPTKTGGICVNTENKVEDADKNRFEEELSYIEEEVDEAIKLKLSLPKL